MIICHSVVQDFGPGDFRRRVLDHLDCVISPRAQLVVLGQRGSGKTTLLQILAGQIIPTRGWVERRGMVSPPRGLLRFAQRQTSPRQLITLVGRLYGVNRRGLLEFVREFSGIGRLLDEPMAAIPAPQRHQLNLAITYGIPFDYYMIDGNVGKGQQPGFSDLCMAAFNARRKNSGVIFATSNVRIAAQIGGSGAIIHQGRVTLYSSLHHAIQTFATLPKQQSLFDVVQRPEEQDLAIEDELF